MSELRQVEQGFKKVDCDKFWFSHHATPPDCLGNAGSSSLITLALIFAVAGESRRMLSTRRMGNRAAQTTRQYSCCSHVVWSCP